MTDESPPPGTVTAMVETVNGQVTGIPSGSATNTKNDLPYQQGTGLATQAVAQAMAIAVQDAVDLLRNIGTIETTAIGVATANWIKQPENVFYPVIIETCTSVISDVAKLMSSIGEQSAGVLKDYKEAAQ